MIKKNDMIGDGLLFFCLVGGDIDDFGAVVFAGSPAGCSAVLDAQVAAWLVGEPWEIWCFKRTPSLVWGYPVETRGAPTFREHHNQKNSS